MRTARFGFDSGCLRRIRSTFAHEKSWCLNDTPKKSEKRLKKRATSLLTKAPDTKHLIEGQRLAKQYRLIIQPDPDVGYVGSSVEMPLVFGEGATTSACIADTLKALSQTIAVMLALGEHPPSPASLDKREVQVNIRLTAREKMLIDEAARRTGFRSISDFLRTAALRHTG